MRKPDRCLGLPKDLTPPIGTRRYASCRTKYVRGREAGEAGVRSVAGIANRNSSFILQWRFCG